MVVLLSVVALTRAAGLTPPVARESLSLATPAAMAEHKSARQITAKTIRLLLRVGLVALSIDITFRLTFMFTDSPLDLELVPQRRRATPTLVIFLSTARRRVLSAALASRSVSI